MIYSFNFYRSIVTSYQNYFFLSYHVTLFGFVRKLHDTRHVDTLSTLQVTKKNMGTSSQVGEYIYLLEAILFSFL